MGPHPFDKIVAVAKLHFETCNQRRIIHKANLGMCLGVRGYEGAREEVFKRKKINLINYNIRKMFATFKSSFIQFKLTFICSIHNLSLKN